MRALDDTVSVGAQVSPDDVKKLASLGVKTLINNRPDGEIFGQPGSTALAKIAEAEGMTYHYIPMGQLSQDAIDASIEAYKSSPRPIAAFCASGTRSTVLWCFVNSEALGVDGVLEAAAAAGYELEQIRKLLTARLEHIGKS